MIELKRQTDKLFLIVAVVLLLLGLFNAEYNSIFYSALIGIVVGSLICEKDFRRVDNNSTGSIGLNLAMNLGLYCLTFLVILFVFGYISILFAGLGLVIYRKVLFHKVYLFSQKEGE